MSAASGTNLAIDSRELREWAASKLPDYMVPTTVTVLDKFPLTANGKLDRRALPEPDLAELSAHVAARNEVEQQFCTLIASAVGLDSVGVTDDFFALGGGQHRRDLTRDRGSCCRFVDQSSRGVPTAHRRGYGACPVRPND